MFPLVRYFSIVSAVVMGIAMVVVAVVFTKVTTGQLIEQREAANVALTKAFSNSIWPDFRRHVDEVAGLDGDQLRAHADTRRFDEVVRATMEGLSVVKVKVYALNGNTVFSTEPSQMGAMKGATPGFGAASSGDVATEISHRDTFSAFEQEVFDIDVVSSYVPIRGRSGAIEGVFEVYDNVTATLAKIHSERNLVMMFVGCLFAALYVILLLIVRRAARQMSQQHQQIVNAKSDLEAVNTDLTAEIEQRQEVQETLEATNAALVERTGQLQAAQETLVKQERLATLGELTATVSHELRNPMGAIRSSLYLAKQKTEGQGLGVERALDRAERNIVRCDNIIAELLDFARDTPPNLEEIAADSWLRQTLAEQDLPEGVEIALELGAASATIAFDQERLRRAVINVIDNAVQAMVENPPERGKRLTVTTGLQQDRFDIIVQDTGPGMDDETLEKIFEPLFSTKSFGVGLGVPTVKKILESHGGGIRYDSTLGRGTTVTLWLPSPVSKEKAA